MLISKLQIQNFQIFKDITFFFNHDLNVLTGINNTGKTTVLEAIALWNECFRILLVQAQKSNRKLNIEKGDYTLGLTGKNYFSYDELISVRSPNYESIFYNQETSNVIFLKATIQNENASLDIGFHIRAASGGQYEIYVEDHTKLDYKTFNSLFKDFANPIQVVYASPIAALQAVEDFETTPKIINKVQSRQSILVLRNRLYELKRTERTGDWGRFTENLSSVLSSRIEFEFSSDFSKDVKAIVKAQVGSKGGYIDISLLGSGTLQIIEILLAVFVEKKDLTIILLDEPDSHIHRDIQKRLLELLLEHSLDNQIFLTTHNESLIRSTHPRNLFFLHHDDDLREYRPITGSEPPRGGKRGLQPGKYSKINESLGGESALDLLNALESEKLIFVEGRDDAKYIQTILDNKYNNKDFNVMFWSMGGIEQLLKSLESLKSILSQIKNKQSLWEKSVIVFDKDLMRDIHRQNLMTTIKDKFKINTHIWSSYTIESTLLTDTAAFSRLLAKFTKSLGQEITESQLTPIIENEIDNIKNQKIAELNNSDILSDLFTYLKGRKSRFDKLGFNAKNIIQEHDAQLQPYYVKEALEFLNSGQIHQISTKDDVDEIIQNVLKHFNIPFSLKIDEYFNDLLELSGFTIWFSEWDALVDLVQN